MPRKITLKLDSAEVCQLLDALTDRRDAYQYTADYLLSGYEQEGRIIEECSDAEEAQEIAAFFADIIEHVEEQYSAQRDSTRGRKSRRH